jgi:hypothetical protein
LGKDIQQHVHEYFHDDKRDPGPGADRYGSAAEKTAT